MRRVRAVRNDKCRKLFGARGGAVGFSRSRAEAVAALLGDRVEGVGLAGSRPPMDTKNGRRVEFLCPRYQARRRRADGTDLPPGNNGRGAFTHIVRPLHRHGHGGARRRCASKFPWSPSASSAAASP